MKFKGNLAGIVIGAAAAMASLASCDDRPEVVIHPVNASTGGAGGGVSSGGMGGSGGAGNGSGNGGSGAGSSADYPDYIDDIETHTTPEFMDVVYCMIEKHEELQNYGVSPRAGIVMVGTSTCGGCMLERDEIGQEGMRELAVHGIYVDPFFNDKSMQRAIDVGVYYVPAANIVQDDMFPTTESPEGILTHLKRRKEGFHSLQELADLVGCEYNPLANARLTDKQDLGGRYSSMQEKLNFVSYFAGKSSW